MRLSFAILLLTCTTSFGQYNPYAGEPIDTVIRKGDSLEKKYEGYSGLKQVNDTLPPITYDESSGLRNMRLITYYYDGETVNKISFRNGQEGYYYFYFEGSYLRKIRISQHAGLIDIQYYYTILDNKASDAQIKLWSQTYPDKEDMYELLRTAKSFLAKFSALH